MHANVSFWSVCPSVRTSVVPSVHLFVCLSVCMSACIETTCGCGMEGTSEARTDALISTSKYSYVLVGTSK